MRVGQGSVNRPRGKGARRKGDQPKNEEDEQVEDVFEVGWGITTSLLAPTNFI